jgi:hypothetical protein
MSTKRTTPFRPEPENSRLDNWYRSDGAEVKAKSNWWYKFRTPKVKSYLDVPPRLDIEICKKYGVYTITFGEWVSQFDRLNFTATLKTALEDLDLLLPRKANSTEIGKEMLTIDWGGRGRKGAAGIYNTDYQTLHLRRYTRADKLLKRMESIGENPNKYIAKYFDPVKGQFGQTSYQLNEEGYVWILGSSGFGSFAHEYGHFIDNYLGIQLKTIMATGLGLFPYKSTVTFKEIVEAFTQQPAPKYIVEPADMSLTEDIFSVQKHILLAFMEIYYNPIKGEKGLYKPSAALKRLHDYTLETLGKWSYWGSFIEVWARAFETYVQYKLMDRGIKNTFLVSDAKKFEVQVKVVDGKEITETVGRRVYPTKEEIKRVYKHIDAVMRIFATH